MPINQINSIQKIYALYINKKIQKELWKDIINFCKDMMSQRVFRVSLISSTEEIKCSFLKYNWKGQQNRSNLLKLKFIGSSVEYKFHFLNQEQDRLWYQPSPEPKFVILLLSAYEEIHLDMITQINKVVANALYFMIVIHSIDKCDAKLRRYMEKVVGQIQLKTIAKCTKLDASISNLSGQFSNGDQFLKNLLFAAGAYEKKCIQYASAPNKEIQEKQQLKILLQDMLNRRQIDNQQIIIQFLLEYDVNTALIFVPVSKRVPLFNQLNELEKYQIYLKMGKVEIKNEKLSTHIKYKAEEQTHDLLCSFNIKQMDKSMQIILSNKICVDKFDLENEQKQRFQILYQKCKIIQVYHQLLKYEEQLQFCYDTHSDEVYKQEAHQFFQCIFNQTRRSIQQLKMKCIYDSADQFKYRNSRQKVQRDIENALLAPNQIQNHLNYVNDPAQFLAEQYQKLRKISIEELKLIILESVKSKLQEFQLQKQIFSILLMRFKQRKFESANHNQLFLIARLSLQDITSQRLNEQISQLVYYLFVDLLTSKPNLLYKGQNIQLKIKDLSMFQNLIRNISNGKYRYSSRISHLFEFVKNVLNQFQSSSFRNYLNQMTSINSQDIKIYTQKSAVYICKQRCPGCGKICSIDTLHQKHEIRFGHQVRAFGGVKMNNGVGSAVTCENVEQNSLIQFNGQKMTWKQFMVIHENKKVNSWSFKDLKQNKSKNAQMAAKSWANIGQTICQSYGIKYANVNEKTNYSKVESIHYIFALDDSGSMYGQRWQNLMNSFRITIKQIQSIPEAHKYIKVSVLIQGTTCLIYQQNCLASMLNTGIPFRSGGNNFSDTFEKAYQIMCKYIVNSKIKFIFMTDGGCSYPDTQIQKIKQLKIGYPNKIEYYGIEFQCSGDVMNQISQQLEGKNTVSHTADNLTNNYLESAVQMEIINST